MKRYHLLYALLICFIFIGCSKKVLAPDTRYMTYSARDFQGLYQMNVLEIWGYFLMATSTPSRARDFDKVGDTIELKFISETTLKAELTSDNRIVDVIEIKGKIQNGGFVSNRHPSVEFLWGFLNAGTEKVSLWWSDSSKKELIVRRHYSFTFLLVLFPVFGNSGFMQCETTLVP